MEKVKDSVKEKKKESSTIHGVGRRKTSVARVWLSRGKGNVVINKRSLGDYFNTEFNRLAVLAPTKVCSFSNPSMM